MEKHFTYDATLKTKVILCAEKIGNLTAGRKYTVSEACEFLQWMHFVAISPTKSEIG
jgi:hypothetical protein